MSLTEEEYLCKIRKENKEEYRMTEILTVAEMRESDTAAIAAGTPGRELMYRAGEGIFRAGEWKAPAAVVCGTGNNAGDGYVLAMLLKQAGVACDILLQEERFTPDGRYWFDRCTQAGVPVRLFFGMEIMSGELKQLADHPAFVSAFQRFDCTPGPNGIIPPG